MQEKKYYKYLLIKLVNENKKKSHNARNKN